MPTFVFFQFGKEVARLQGATKEPIEQTIKKFYKDTPTKDAGYVRDQITCLLLLLLSLLTFIDRFKAIY